MHILGVKKYNLYINMMIGNIYKKYPPDKYIYRGSLHHKKMLYPREYKAGKKVIFATSNLELAISYIRKSPADIAQSDTGTITLLELKKGEFNKTLTTSGYIYILDKTKFKKSPYKNLKTEYISTKIQKPVDIIVIKNPLQMLKKSKGIKLISV